MNTTIRNPAAPDFVLISDSWQKSFLGLSRDRPRGIGPLSNMVPAVYFSNMSKAIDRILGTDGVNLRVLCWEEDPDFIVGWVCGDPERRILHFVYVSHLHRQEGHGTRLMGEMFDRLGQSPITATHWTRVLPYYLGRWWLQYNPFVLQGIWQQPRRKNPKCPYPLHADDCDCEGMGGDR